MPTFTLDQIGRSSVRFPSGIPIPTMTDAATDPYAKTRVSKAVQVEGLQFWPQEKAAYPGVVLLHDWWGLNAPVQDLAVSLAREGYTVLLPNLYVRQGGVVTANTDVAAALMARAQAKDLLQDINSCCEFLNTRDHVKRNLHAVVGIGMGGGLAIQFGCQRKRLRAAVAFSGLPPPAETLQSLYCPLLYHHLANDDRVSTADVERLDRLAQSGKKVTIKHYEHAGRDFIYEQMKDAYRPEAAGEAWTATVQFLHDCLT